MKSQISPEKMTQFRRTVHSFLTRSQKTNEIAMNYVNFAGKNYTCFVGYFVIFPEFAKNTEIVS